MTAPRRVVAGTTYLVTRRTAQRQFLLKPSSLTDGTVGYVLGVAQARYGILVHAVAVLSNHLHLVVTDPDARLPQFCQYFDSLVARAMNAGLDRWEAFWSPGSFSAVALVGQEDVVAKTVYTLANPVAAGLVARGRDWPGLWSSPDDLGGAWRTFERPGHFFSKKGRMPELATVTLSPPPGFEADAFRAAVSEGLAAEEKAAEHDPKRKVLGVRGIKAQKHTDVPASAEPRRGLNPHVAARDKWKRIEAVLRLKAFRDAYRTALAAFRDGAADTVFPHGTYQLRVFLGVKCEGAA